MKDKPMKQPWPRSAKITVWVLSLLLVPTLFYAIAVEPNPCGCESEIIIDPPKQSCLPVADFTRWASQGTEDQASGGFSCT